MRAPVVAPMTMPKKAESRGAPKRRAPIPSPRRNPPTRQGRIRLRGRGDGSGGGGLMERGVEVSLSG